MAETTKMLLPPISTLAAGMPILSLDFMNVPQPEQPVEEKEIIPQIVNEPKIMPQTTKKLSKEKQTTFSALEDISILKAMRLYLGKNVTFKIPWSFWQIYRRSTGSQRSDSSLYHHWNGAMAKKYSNFIKDGRIDECIKWAESALDVESLKRERQASQEQPESRALIHTRSHQVVPPSYFNLNDEQTDTNPQPRHLAHFNSLQNCDTFFNF